MRCLLIVVCRLLIGAGCCMVGARCVLFVASDVLRGNVLRVACWLALMNVCCVLFAVCCLLFVCCFVWCCLMLLVVVCRLLIAVC